MAKGVIVGGNGSKGSMLMWLMLILVAAILTGVGLKFGGGWYDEQAAKHDFLPSSTTGGVIQSESLKIANSAGGAYDYTGKIVEISLQSTNKYTAAAIDPTFYVYDEKPENWGNKRIDVEDGYISAVSSSSGTATLSEVPGQYYVRAQVSTYYDEYFMVTVPASGDVPLSQWNDGGEGIVKIQFVDIETLSTSNQDMGITTNETSDKTYHVYTNFNVDDNEGFMLDEIKFREDATYSFATDTDGNGVYDEGINEIKFHMNGKTWTLFSVAGSIDEFSGDDEAIIDINDGDDDSMLFGENGVVSMHFEITCDATLDTTGDADGKCGNGEGFIDDVILVDASGATATFEVVG